MRNLLQVSQTDLEEDSALASADAQQALMTTKPLMVVKKRSGL